MAATHRAPKQWCLTKKETVNTFENWKQNLIYSLRMDNSFKGFLTEGTTWGKKSRQNPHRGFHDDEPDAIGSHTAEEKVCILEMMLGQIANYCPVISRSSILNATSLPQIWQMIRLHYGFQSSGAHFIDLAFIQLEADESPEDLYQRLMAFVEDNLLRSDGNLTHHDNLPTEDEELSPTLENMIVLRWLILIHADLPRLIKQRYGTELRSRTLSSIRPEISQSIPSLLSELRGEDDTRAMRTSTGSSYNEKNPRPTKYDRKKSCPICSAVKRKDDHWLSECRFLPPSDKQFMTRARQISDIFDSPRDSTYSECDDDDYEAPSQQPATVQRVSVR